MPENWDALFAPPPLPPAEQQREKVKEHNVALVQKALKAYKDAMAWKEKD